MHDAIDNGNLPAGVTNRDISYHDSAPAACCECGESVSERDLNREYPRDEQQCVRCRLMEADERLRRGPQSLNSIAERLAKEFPNNSMLIEINVWSHRFSSGKGETSTEIVIAFDGAGTWKRIRATNIDAAIGIAKAELGSTANEKICA